MDMQPRRKRDDDGETSRPVRQVFERNEPLIAQTRQRRRAHLGGWIDFFLDGKSSPIKYGPIQIPLIVPLWVGVGTVIDLPIFVVTTWVLRLVGHISYKGVNIWTGEIYWNSFSPLSIAIFVATFLFLVGNIEYIKRLRIWLLGAAIWFTIVYGIQDVWNSFSNGRVSLSDAFDWNLNPISQAEVWPKTNLLVVFAVAFVLAVGISILLFALNWVTGKWKYRNG